MDDLDAPVSAEQFTNRLIAANWPRVVWVNAKLFWTLFRMAMPSQRALTYLPDGEALAIRWHITDVRLKNPAIRPDEVDWSEPEGESA